MTKRRIETTMTEEEIEKNKRLWWKKRKIARRRIPQK
jgi:hypothetical protein